ncbi:MAG: methionyl-tRNA formyltransferase [Granulosicoccus sp.]
MNCDRLKVAFAGTPEFAAVALDALLGSAHELVGVLTQPDRPAGRGRKLTPSAVKIRALEAGVPVQQPVSLKTAEALQEFQSLNADVLVVAAYGLILPQSVLDTPVLGCLNIHASLLPRWRGAAPIHRAILAGDRETGVCIMQMDAGLDTGDVLLESRCVIGDDENVAQLHDRLAQLGAQALLETLPARCRGEMSAIEQPQTGVSYAEKLTKSEARLNFELGADEIHRRVRAFNPWPVAEAMLCGQRVRFWRSRKVDGERLDSQAVAGKIVRVGPDAIRVCTGDKDIEFLQLQWPGKKAQSAADFAQGQSLLGEVFKPVVS